MISGALFFQVAAIIVLCAVPPVSRDALTHHLALPKIYLEKGLSTELPHIPFSYFPMNVDLLYMATMSFSGDVAIKYIHFAFGLLTALLVYFLLRRWINGQFGMLGALLFLSLPVIVKLSISAYVDLGLAFFSTAALLAILKWMANNRGIQYLLAAAVFCGLALGTKYNALLVLCIMTLSIPLVVLQRDRMQQSAAVVTEASPPITVVQSIGPAVLFCLVAMMMYAPWAIRNIVWTGNPIYPLYQSVFEKVDLAEDEVIKSENDRIRELYNSQINRDHLLVRRTVYKESPLQIALIPLRIFLQGQDDNPRYFDGKLHPLLLFFPFFIFLNLKHEVPAVRFGKLYLLGFSWLYILMAALSTDIRIRYIMPAIPPLVILSVCGFYSLLVEIKDRLGHKHTITVGTLAFLLIIMIPNMSYVRGLFQRYAPLDYLAGRIDRDSYIGSFRPEYPVLQYINRSLPPDSRILSIFGGNRRYYCDRELFFNNEWFKSLMIEQSSEDGISEAMQEKGITHIMVNEPFYQRWMYDGLTTEQRHRADALFGDQMKLIYTENEHQLYQFNSSR